MIEPRSHPDRAAGGVELLTRNTVTSQGSIRFVVTIDGPAASGKSSVARGLAAALGVPYLSSGLLYRAVAVAGLEAGLDLGDEAAVLALLGRRRVALEPGVAGNHALIDGRDVTLAAHSSRVDATVSRVARHPGVRAWVNASLRGLPPPFVAEGRDMGAAVFPGARVKLYLTAPARVRALRRSAERPEDVEAIEAALLARDDLDAENSRPAPDATLIDTAGLGLAEVVARSLEVVRAAAGEG